MQLKLNEEQIAAFYHDEFVDSQVANFNQLVLEARLAGGVIVDIGGGVGHFASAISSLPGVKEVRVIDMDATSIKQCKARGLSAYQGDALHPPMTGDENVICFNLILHHLVGSTEKFTTAMQRSALSVWQRKSQYLFVNEYIYDSYKNDLSGKIIYFITKNKFLSTIGGIFSKIIPSLRANTFGIGVRFRSEGEWRNLFKNLGYEIVGYARGKEEHVSFPRRCLLIKSCRRDSFLLQSQ